MYSSVFCTTVQAEILPFAENVNAGVRQHRAQVVGYKW